MEAPFPPFDPDGENNPPLAPRDASKTRLRDIPLRTLIPNLVTLLAICSGLTAVRLSMEGRLELAVAAILLAGFLDGMDGRIARFFKSATRFGAQMDSLADFVNFGVAPALVLYSAVLSEARSTGWIAALIYVICAGLRLARFNVMLDNPKQAKWHSQFFIGVPAPAGAIIVLMPVYLVLLGVENNLGWAWFTTLFTVASGLLMISSVPTFSGKNMSEKVRRDLVVPLLILVVFLAAVLFTYPWGTLLTVGTLYLISIPIAYRSWERQHLEEIAQTSATRRKSRKKDPAKK